MSSPGELKNSLGQTRKRSGIYLWRMYSPPLPYLVPEIEICVEMIVWSDPFADDDRCLPSSQHLCKGQMEVSVNRCSFPQFRCCCCCSVLFQIWLLNRQGVGFPKVFFPPKRGSAWKDQSNSCQLGIPLSAHLTRRMEEGEGEEFVHNIICCMVPHDYYHYLPFQFNRPPVHLNMPRSFHWPQPIWLTRNSSP